MGAFTLSRVRNAREVPLASIPLVFAAQQAIEGTLWIGLGAGAPLGLTSALANTFALIALAVWPVLSPAAAFLVERVATRRAAMLLLLMIGIPVTAYGFWNTGAYPYNVCIVSRTLSYTSGSPYPPLALGAYFACTVLPMLLSSQNALRVFGAIIALGLGVSLAIYYVAFVSVWCFFAAAASATLVVHFSFKRAFADLALTRPR